MPICFALAVLIQLHLHSLASTLMFCWNIASPSGPSEPLKIVPASKGSVSWPLTCFEYTTLGSSISRVLLSQADDKPNAQLGAYVCFTFLLWGSHSCPSKDLMRLGGLCKATSIGRWWVRIQSQIETQNLWWTLCGQCWCATQRPTQRKPIFVLLTLREVLCQPRSALVIHVTEQ